MLIRNQAKLKSKHPNYETEIDFIKEVVDAVVLILNTDLTEVVNSIDGYAWNVRVKNYFLTGQPKEIHCETSNEEGKKSGFTKLFDKGGWFSTNITHPAIISAVVGNDAFDRIYILLTGKVYQIHFGKEGVYSGNIDVSAQSGEPVLLNYSLKKI